MSAQVFTGRYQIERQVARGGMAEVYLARDLLLDRPVALKVLFPEFSSDASFVERFRREARAAANLNHPNIVSIYDWGEDTGTYFIVMEYVDGRTLRDVIRAEGPLPANRAAEIGAEIASALHFAHLNGVVHRDVKPGNVMIAARQVKVTDFGIARAGDPSEGLTQTGAVMGTATYFSPEQAQGHNVDLRSDVYSLGVVLYEMVTARAPFTGDNPVSIAYQHVREEPIPPSQVNPDVPRVFDAIVAKAMAKSRDVRYPSAEALRADLLRFSQGASVAILPPPGGPMAAPTTGTVPATPAAAYAPTGMIQRVPVSTDNTRTIMNHDVVPVAPQRQRTSAYIVILVVLLAILAGMLFLLARELGVGDTEQVAVPPVVGLTEEEATDALRDAGLRAKSEQVPDTANEAGRVTDQDPEADTRVDRNSTVTIKVSSGAAAVAVPDVRRKSLDAATDLLRDGGFEVVVNRRTDDSVDPDIVIDQNPLPGQQVPQGSEVILVVSSGPEQVRVPDVRNRTEGEAANTMGQAGFRTASRSEESSAVASGRVIRTEPDAGTPLDKGDTVTLVVSSGPAPTSPPQTTPTTSPPIITLPTFVPPTTTIPATTTST